MLLRRLKSVLPAHLVEHIATLDDLGIKTTENLVYTPRPHLSNLPIPPEDLDEIIALVLELTGPDIVRGDAELETLAARKSGVQWRGFGARNLDRLADWDGVGVVEISGAKRVGKTLLALHSALRVLVHDESAVARWIDTEGSFSAARARSILETMACQNVEAVLQRLVVTPCFQLEPDLFEAIAGVKDSLDMVDAGLETRTKVLVIDPIVTLFKDTLSSTTSQAMVMLMEELAELTYRHDLLTIITTSTVSSRPTFPLSRFSATTTKPSLGTAFTYHTDISLFVQETGKVFYLLDEVERDRTRTASGLRGLVEVVKSKVSPSGRWAVFETDGLTLLEVVPQPPEDERTLLMSAGIPVGPPRPIHGPLAQTVIP